MNISYFYIFTKQNIKKYTISFSTDFLISMRNAQKPKCLFFFFQQHSVLYTNGFSDDIVYRPAGGIQELLEDEALKHSLAQHFNPISEVCYYIIDLSSMFIFTKKIK